VIETQRLLLRKPTVADVEDPPAFLADPRVMDFLGGVEDSRGVVRQWVDGWETYPAGKLIVEAAGERIGRVGFNFYDPERWVRSSSPDAQPELTWALAHEHWGKGYATEAARAMVSYGFDELELARIVATTENDNLRSIAVMKRIGMTIERNPLSEPHWLQTVGVLVNPAA
jgi:RimJ/RimL family protein N-acetyltransferase